MSLFEAPSLRRPESAPPTSPATPRRDGGGTSPQTRDEGRPWDRRTAILGLLGLAALVVVALNLAAYQAALQNASNRFRSHLASLATLKRGQLENHLIEVRRRAWFLASEQLVRTAAWLAERGQLDPERRRELARALRTTQEALAFPEIMLVVRDQVVMVGPEPRKRRAVPSGFLALAREATLSQNMVVGDLRPGPTRGLETIVAVPVVPAEGTSRVVLLVRAPIPEVEGVLLSQWPGLPGQARGYVARREGKALLITELPSGASRTVGEGQRGWRAAEVAAAGIESDGEGVNAERRPVFTCTRFMPSVGWGMVGELPRAVVVAEMRSVLAGLLLFDCAVAATGVILFTLWRRRYAQDLAAREIEVTRRHAQRVQAIFDTAFDAILTFDHDQRVRTANRAAERLFGRSATDLEGSRLDGILRGGDGQIPGALPPPGTVGVARAVRANGESFPAEVSLGETGEAESRLYTAVVRDVSDRVEAERQIRTFAQGLERSNRRLEEVNAQLEQASRLKSEFLANTSHELRTPLNGMIGFLQLVLDGLCRDKKEEREFQTQALACSRHLLGLINDVLDIAKIESGKLSLEVSQVDVEHLFREVYTLTHVQAAQKGIALRFVDPPAPATLRCDFSKAKQVFVNLVGNSIKFTEKGSVTVKAVPHPELGHVMFEIVDTGIGIPLDRQKLIFEKFTQGDGSTTRRYGGTGLGLAISKSLVELMGGVIGVQSEGPGKGARFYFSLPSWGEAAVAEKPVEELERIQGPAQGPLLLVVEDDPAFRQYVCTLLHRSGYRTVEATGAEQGWLLARRHSPALIVLDYALACPEDASLRTGWDLAERVAATAETRHIPLIFLTGFDGELKDKLRATAFARRPEHLVKPIDGNRLLGKIEEVLGPRPDRSVRVLLADDDPTVTAYVRRVLPESRFQLEVARNGEECLHVMRTQPRGFDLLLLDLMMPDVSGYDVLREMVLTSTGSEIPVLVLTNFPDPRNDEERRLLEQGLVIDVLPKMIVHEDSKRLPQIIDWHLNRMVDNDRREAA